MADTKRSKTSKRSKHIPTNDSGARQSRERSLQEQAVNSFDPALCKLALIRDSLDSTEQGESITGDAQNDSMFLRALLNEAASAIEQGLFDFRLIHAKADRSRGAASCEGWFIDNLSRW